MPRVCAFVLLLGSVALTNGCGQPGPRMAHGKPVGDWVQGLQDPDVRVRKKAATVLGNVGAVDPAVVPALAAALKDRDAGVRNEAVLALLKIGPAAQDAGSALAEAQTDRDPRVRMYAAQALQRIRGEK
jgi:HEAT repeat protein